VSEDAFVLLCPSAPSLHIHTHTRQITYTIWARMIADRDWDAVLGVLGLLTLSHLSPASLSNLNIDTTFFAFTPPVEREA